MTVSIHSMLSLGISAWPWGIALGGTVAFLIWFRQRPTRKPPFPPGPPGLPLLKNLFDVPMVLEHITYQKWGEKYGDVSHISVLGTHIVVLNSEKAAVELLDQRSAIYSDRPYLPMAHDQDLMGLDFAFSLKRYSPSWKLHRRLFTQYINSTTVSGRFATRQLTGACELLYNLLSNSSPADIMDVYNQASASMILGITYGYNPQPKNDPLVELATDLVRLGFDGVAPKFLVNVFPVFKYFHWLPGVTFKQYAANVRGVHQRLHKLAYGGAKQRIDSGDYTASFVQNALAEYTDGGDSETLQAIKEVALQMYGAGVDTTATTLHSLTLQLILHPHVQARAHAELDAVLGSPDSPSFRLPTFDHRSAFPYIDALIKESLRVTPPAAVGVPHATSEEDVYRGWRIPKGSIIMANVYGMNRDERVYPDPHKFDPERFIEKPGKPAQVDPAGAFGFGRRICPGRHLAESMVWIEIVCLLAAFTIEPPMDDNTGKPMDLRWAEKHQLGAILRFASYPCVFKPRSDRVVKVIRELALQATP